MKLGKLLAAGKSIMSGRSDISYRSSKQIYLPKFGPVKNPFKPESSPSAEETANDAPEHDSHSSPLEAGKPAAALSSIMIPESGPGPVRAANPESPTAPNDGASDIAQKLPPLPGMRKKTGWIVKFNPASIFRAVPSKVAFGEVEKSAPTQTELSLDSVRVVHNDLTDVDVEVVPIKSRTGKSPEKPVKKPLDLLGERLFGVEPT
jgi:hypothetical protein